MRASTQQNVWRRKRWIRMINTYQSLKLYNDFESYYCHLIRNKVDRNIIIMDYFTSKSIVWILGNEYFYIVKNTDVTELKYQSTVLSVDQQTCIIHLINNEKMIKSHIEFQKESKKFLNFMSTASYYMKMN